MFSRLRKFWQTSETAMRVEEAPRRFTYTCTRSVIDMGPSGLGGTGYNTDAIIKENYTLTQEHGLNPLRGITVETEEVSSAHSEDVPEHRNTTTFIHTGNAIVKHHRPYRYRDVMPTDDTELTLYDNSFKEIAHTVIPLERGEHYVDKRRARALGFFDANAQSLCPEEQESMRNAISALMHPNGCYRNGKQILEELGGIAVSSHCKSMTHTL